MKNLTTSYLENPLFNRPSNFKGASCINTNLTGMKNVTDCVLPNVTIVDSKEIGLFKKFLNKLMRKK
jgi:hypothetical protein